MEKAKVKSENGGNSTPHKSKGAKEGRKTIGNFMGRKLTAKSGTRKYGESGGVRFLLMIDWLQPKSQSENKDFGAANQNTSCKVYSGARALFGLPANSLNISESLEVLKPRHRSPYSFTDNTGNIS